jgi:hypothetical protein
MELHSAAITISGSRMLVPKRAQSPPNDAQRGE